MITQALVLLASTMEGRSGLKTLKRMGEESWIVMIKFFVPPITPSIQSWLNNSIFYLSFHPNSRIQLQFQDLLQILLVFGSLIISCKIPSWSFYFVAFLGRLSRSIFNFIVFIISSPFYLVASSISWN
jgi:hypothetical protein